MDLGRPDRRDVLGLFGLGIAGAVCPPRFSTPRKRIQRDKIDDLCERLRVAPRERAFDVAADAIRAGADHETMLAAIFLAGVLDVRPRPHGILHCVMMVESAFQLAELSPPREAWLVTLFNLDDLKRSQEQDRSEAGDWKMPERPDSTGSARASASEARAEFLAAMEAWDAERADRALVDLLPHVDHEAFAELLWPLAARCSAYIGHKAIYAAQVERVLRRIGWSHAEAPLRSLVRTLLVERETETLERSRDIANAFPASWREGAADPAASEELLRTLRSSTSTRAAELVREALEDGLGPASVWDGLRLFGAELFQRRPGRSADTGRAALLPVHALTVTNALGHAYRSTKSEPSQRLLLLQAASWLPAIRDSLSEIVGLSMEGPGLDALGSDETDGAEDLEELFEGGSAAHCRAFLDRGPGRVPRYLERLRSSLFHKGQEHHQHKYAAVLHEESALVHPRWSSRILAPAIDYLAHPNDPDTDTYERSLHALRKAGVG